MSKKIRTSVIAGIAMVWAVVIIAVLIWQTYYYTGIIGILAEWQFRTFDRFFPVTTIALLLFLLTLPFMIVLGLRLRREHRARYADKAERAVYRATLFRKFLIAGAAGSLVAAIIPAIVGMTVGGISDTPRAVSLGDAGRDLANGPAQLRGTVLLDRIGYYREGFAITGRNLWVAPIVSDIDSQEVSFFVQVARRDAGEPQSGTFKGILQRKGMPGGLATLYRNSGYNVGRQTYVLFDGRASARWPYLSMAADFFIMALLFGLVILLHGRHLKKLKKYRDSLNPVD